MSGHGAETLQSVLGRLANDYRRTVSYYGNVEAREGFSSALRRLFSGTGFPDATQFSYLVPASAHVTRNENQRSISRVTFHPYGLREDVLRLRDTSEVGRRITTNGEVASTGLRPHPANADYLMSASLDDATYSESKTISLVRDIVNPRRGPAYHVVINRRGDVIVACAIDDTTRAAGPNAELSLDVAIESAFVLSREAYTARRVTPLIEMPLTTLQIAAICTVIGKVTAAYPSIPSRLVVADTSAAGYAYRWPFETSVGRAMNFSSHAWANNSPFDHTDSDAPRIFEIANSRGAFDVSSEVFRSADAPDPRAGRVEAQMAVAQADTAGAESVMLGAYSVIAAEERAADMQSTSRLQLFVQRIQLATHDASSAGVSAGHVAEASAPHTPTPATNVNPHVFDFITGLWGDGSSY